MRKINKEKSDRIMQQFDSLRGPETVKRVVLVLEGEMKRTNYPTKFIICQQSRIINKFIGEGENFYQKVDSIMN